MYNKLAIKNGPAKKLHHSLFYTSFHSKVLSNVDRNFIFNFLVNFNFVLPEAATQSATLLKLHFGMGVLL